MKKRNLLISSLIAAGALAAVGCETGGESGGSGGLVKIRVDSQYGKGMQELLATMADEFNNQNKGKIEVTVNQISGGYKAVLTSVKADLDVNQDQWADLVCCYPDHVCDYLEYGKVVNLDQFIYSKDKSIAFDVEDLTDSAKTYLDIQYPASGTYAMPYSISTECMFYNPAILGVTIAGVNNGLPINEEYIENLTWDEFFDNFCPKFKAYNANLPAADRILDTSTDWSILGYDDDGNAFITLAQQYGYGYTSIDEYRNPSIDFNNPEMKALLKKWNGYKNEHYVLSEGSYKDKRPSSELFAKKPPKCLFTIGSTGGLSYHKPDLFEIRCAPVPQVDLDNRQFILQGGSWCILSHNSADNKARQQAAWKFYKYLTTYENCARWSTDTGYAPLRNSVYRGEEWAEISDLTPFIGKPSKDNLYARNAIYLNTVKDELFTNEVFKGSSSARNYCEGLFGEILTLTVAQCTESKINEKFLAAYNNTLNDL